jgi:hypothetical protein
MTRIVWRSRRSILRAFLVLVAAMTFATTSVLASGSSESADPVPIPTLPPPPPVH